MWSIRRVSHPRATSCQHSTRQLHHASGRLGSLSGSEHVLLVGVLERVEELDVVVVLESESDALCVSSVSSHCDQRHSLPRKLSSIIWMQSVLFVGTALGLQSFFTSFCASFLSSFAASLVAICLSVDACAGSCTPHHALNACTCGSCSVSCACGACCCREASASRWLNKSWLNPGCGGESGPLARIRLQGELLILGDSSSSACLL